MTITERIAHRIVDAMLSRNKTEDLGNFAAACELMAAAPGVTLAERRDLKQRAERYRNLQLETMKNS